MATKAIALREIQSSTGPRRPLETQRPPPSCRLTIFSLAVIDVLIHLRLAHTAAIRVLRVVTAPRIIALILTVNVACLRSAEVAVELTLSLGCAPEINQGLLVPLHGPWLPTLALCAKFQQPGPVLAV